MTDADEALDATALRTAYAGRKLSPVEATESALRRIDERDRDLNAFCLVDPDAALADARASERRWRAGEPLGPVDGVPTAVKDLLLGRGWPTMRGSVAMSSDRPAREDAPSVARLREHGAVLLGKTTTPEVGWKGVTDGPLTGVTRNPWDLKRTPGGSSGGSAVAVATQMATLALGTDGGGSIRIPAGFTGTVGFKPTYGRVPAYPASPLATLSHVGPMTRTVADAAAMLDVIARPDSRDASALPRPEVSYAAALGAGPSAVAGLRVAYSPTLGYVSVEPEIAQVLDDAVGVLGQLGARVEQVDPGFGDPLDAFEVLWFAGAAAMIGDLTDRQRELLDPGLAEVCEQGARLSATDYLGAMKERAALGAAMGRFHERYDLLVTPTLPLSAFGAGRETPNGTGRWTVWAPFSYPFNLTRQPAISVPCGFTGEGLPVGMQVIGSRHADGRVLAAAEAYELSRPTGSVGLC